MSAGAQRSETDEPPPLAFGRVLNTTEDVADWFGVKLRTLRYVLFVADDADRYTSFEIPKRTGGMRAIDAPSPFLRQLQDKLLGVLQAAYRPHPSAHGFLPGRSVLTNAALHAGRRHVLNIDLKDFFPSVNFGRVRGLFLKPPFSCGPSAATVLARICTHRNGLPQGAPTSPILSNFAAAELDRRLTRLARGHRLTYSRYADDITLSGDDAAFPPAVAFVALDASGRHTVEAGQLLDREVSRAGFAIHPAKVRLQSRGTRQQVTGLVVNAKANVTRVRIRQLRAMLHAWRKFGIEAAAREHLRERAPQALVSGRPLARQFRGVVYGHLAFIKMVRGPADPVVLGLCAKVLDLDPTPSKFLRQMVFGADDFDVFISHASEDKDAIARPIFEACSRQGLKVFLDEAHIGWGESFTRKINTAMGAARYILAVVSPQSVTKDWPMAELNAALALEVKGLKTVVPVVVGKPDLSQLPLIATRDVLFWSGDAEAVAKRLRQIVRGELPGAARRGGGSAAKPTALSGRGGTAVPTVDTTPATPIARPGWATRLWQFLFGRRPTRPPPAH